APAQQAELRVLLNRERRRVLPGRALREGTSRRTRGHAQSPPQERAAQRHGFLRWAAILVHAGSRCQSASSAAQLARQPGETLVGASERLVFEADGSRKAELVQRLEEPGDSLLPRARLVTSRHAGDLYVLD